MSYNIVYNISCSPNPVPGHTAGRRCSGFIKIVAVAAQLGQSVVAAAVPPYAGVLRFRMSRILLLAAMVAQNAPIYPCMSCQIVPASRARGPASSASGPASASTRPGMRGPASSTRGQASASSARGPCAAWHPARAARRARHRPPARAARHRHLARAARHWHLARAARHRHPARAALHPARAARHQCARHDGRKSMTVIWQASTMFLLVVLRHQPHPGVQRQNISKNVQLRPQRIPRGECLELSPLASM